MKLNMIYMKTVSITSVKLMIDFRPLIDVWKHFSEMMKDRWMALFYQLIVISLTKFFFALCHIWTDVSDVIMSVMASQITDVSIVYSTVCSGAVRRKHQSSMPLAFVRGIHQWLLNSPHKGPLMQKIFPFDDVIMEYVWDLHLSG